MTDRPNPSPKAEGLLRSITFWPNDTNKSDGERKAALRSYIASLEQTERRYNWIKSHEWNGRILGDELDRTIDRQSGNSIRKVGLPG